MSDRTRTDALQAAARALLVAHGVDIAAQVAIRPLAQELAASAGCHTETAKRHIAKAVRVARGELAPSRGGARPGAGRPLGSAGRSVTLPPDLVAALDLLPGRSRSEKTDTLLRTVPLLQMALARVAAGGAVEEWDGKEIL